MLNITISEQEGRLVAALDGEQTVLKALRHDVERVFDISGFLQLFSIEK